jgi:hypothetical protein
MVDQELKSAEPDDHVIEPAIMTPYGAIVAVWDETVFVLRPHEGVIEMDLSEVHFMVASSSLTPSQAKVLRLEPTHA